MKLLFDTGPLVVIFKNEEIADKVEDLLNSVEENKTEGCISSITLSELFYIFARFKGEEFSKSVVEYIKASALSIIPVTDSIAEKAGELKFLYARKNGLPMADAIIAATALEKNATLVTSDDHFKKIKNLNIRWI